MYLGKEAKAEIFAKHGKAVLQTQVQPKVR
jgi:hypothetical protein